MVVKVIDSVPGSGKTSWAINYFNDNPDKNFIFITPLLSEVKRVKKSCPDLNFIEPDRKLGDGRKYGHLIKLVREKRNIASTHSLITYATDGLIELLKEGKYTLVLDEVLDVVSQFDLNFPKDSENEEDVRRSKLTRRDLKSLMSLGAIEILDDFGVSWVDEENILTPYKTLIKLGQRKLIYLINNSFLLWTFPPELFMEGVFDEKFLLTYQFEHQFQSAYFRYFDIAYEYWRVINEDGKYSILEGYGSTQQEFLDNLSSLIEICESPIRNAVGDPYISSNGKIKYSRLSVSSYNAYGNEIIPEIQKQVTGFFTYDTNSTSKDRLWTCLLANKNDIRKKNINVNNWLAMNTRATNDHGDKTTLAYLMNRYPNPYISRFFAQKGIGIDPDGFALSEMIQWIFRSAIRNNKKINIYIPSFRMREMLKSYLRGENISEYKDKAKVSRND